MKVSIEGLLDAPESLQLNGYAEVQDPVEGRKLVLAVAACCELYEVAPAPAAVATAAVAGG